MAEPFVQATSRLAQCCALLAIGYNLKQSGILSTSDGETAIQVATTLTLPSVILQALGNGPPLDWGAASLVGVAVVCVGAQLAATWLYVAQRSVRERAVLSGAATGLSLRLLGYPLAEVFLGGASGGCTAASAAVQSVALMDLVNHITVWVLSYMLFAAAGPAFPESFKHEEGGDYRGQWRGLKKEGLGVYTYASGARYEGEWRNNVKEGRGVYYFPKARTIRTADNCRTERGGVYEGEWSAGSMSGLGVRTFSTGQVKAGRWRDGQFETPLELWQVALASDGATAVAAAARRVEVGGGRWVDAVHMLAAQPTLWALLAGVVFNLARVPLPTSLNLITAVLAQANTPLVLLAVGITAPPLLAAARGLMQHHHQPQQNQPKGHSAQKQLLSDIVRLLGARLLVSLTVVLNLLAMIAAGGVGRGVGGGAFREGASALVPLAASLIALLAPVPPEAIANARRFRLNESTATAITAVSYFMCVPLMLLAGVAACTAGLVTAAQPAATAAVTTADVRPLGLFTLGALAAVSAAVSYVTRSSSEEAEDRRVRMVYTGPVEPAMSSPSPPSSSPSSASTATVAAAMSVEDASATPGAAGTGSQGALGSGTTPLPSASAGSGAVSDSDSSGGSGSSGSGSSTASGARPRLPPAKATTVTVSSLLPLGASSSWATGRALCCGGVLRKAGPVACCSVAIHGRSYTSRISVSCSGRAGPGLCALRHHNHAAASRAPGGPVRQQHVESGQRVGLGCGGGRAEDSNSLPPRACGARPLRQAYGLLGLGHGMLLLPRMYDKAVLPPPQLRQLPQLRQMALGGSGGGVIIR
ncbi:hypothetical protein VOLCADRAFT_96981 [Volvox carteri f. nagariensis]|uniref:Uncharacterized protein n=1 Tax=Volvox carteri f. nagariensis TaxID=3068 RepID=D8UBH2_VOLCA|nr:uncharacterized protein VOLCADRAFT_96981 [Volvox carteri f. nagariensis]EFJ43005.1 hypothetical protein VOLCADRAFT_96981 [Volvox carteri f. nagariensis]|eukprot:XP_002956045.1 hypothetical protein VOLCADRAFT_96981 [Volvox carteri f. nagariensis]